MRPNKETMRELMKEYYALTGDSSIFAPIGYQAFGFNFIQAFWSLYREVKKRKEALYV